MRYLLFIILSLFSVDLISQCEVDSIGIKDCIIGEKEYVIPVHVAYTGKADSIKVEATGLDYSFKPQYWSMYQHFTNPSNLNVFYFTIYDSDLDMNNVDVKVTMIGGTCIAATDYLMKTLVIDDPECFCSDFLVLTGVLNESKDYFVANYIETSQEILTGNDVLYDVANYVDWEDGFLIEGGSSLTINFTGCVIN